MPPVSSLTVFCLGSAGIAGLSADLTKVVEFVGIRDERCGHAEPPLVAGEPGELDSKQENLFLRDTSGSYQLLDLAPPGTPAIQTRFNALSADASHAVFESPSPLTGDTPAGGLTNIYVWGAAQPHSLHLLTVLPDGTPVHGPGVGGAYLAGSENDKETGENVNQMENEAAFDVNGGMVDSLRASHAISANGERVLFYAGGSRWLEGRGASYYRGGGLYLREHPAAGQSSLNECTEAEQAAEPEKACTVQIDLPQGVSGSGGNGQFQWASADTSKIFFTDVEKLTAGSTAQAGKPDLYEYDLEKLQGQRLTDLTANSGEPADVQGVSGASEDGSYLYFVAKGDLTGVQQNSHGDVALAPAEGSGTLSGVVKATGDTSGHGSTQVTGLSVSEGEFHVGQEIEGAGIGDGTTIVACSPSCSSPNELTLSKSTSEQAGTQLTGLGSTEVTGVNVSEGAFHVGMAISGEGISAKRHTWITAVGSGTLTLSQGVTVNGAQVLSASAGNLYLRHAGATTFIAALNPKSADRCDWGLICLSARVSSNGAFIGFDSVNSLTGYDNVPVHPGACTSGGVQGHTEWPCAEIFRYAAGNGPHGELTCASCHPDGSAPAAEHGSANIEFASRTQGTIGKHTGLPHNVSDSGQVFFSTLEKLVPADENEAFNVYEYEAGEGPSAQLHLISSGKSPEPSWFSDATPSGSDVFFVTGQSLLRADTRADYDLYDARVGGGFASQSEAVQPPSCEALEACHPPPSEPPAQSSAASAALFGAGNLASAPVQPVVNKPAKKKTKKATKCPKGKKLSHGKCVKKKPKKSKAKKPTGRRGSK
jgi:hypothetical protein